MFHSPIGGISFITNILIILIGNAMKPFKPRGVSRQYIVTQDSIAHFESTKLGEFISRTIAFAFPALVFISVAGLSLGAMYRLYNDENKVTLFGLTQSGYELGMEKLSVLEGQPMESVAAETTEASASELMEAGAVMGIEDAQSSEDDFLFLHGRDATKLSTFFALNDVDPSFESREEFAHFFGIVDYSGTEEQNVRLLQILKDLTVTELKRMMENQ